MNKTRLDAATEYLRGLAATLSDPRLEDAADLLDEQAAQLFVVDEKLAAYEAPEVTPSREVVKVWDSPNSNTFRTITKTAAHYGAPKPKDDPLPPSS